MKHIITITDKDITGSENLSSAEPRIAVNAVLFDGDGNIAISYMGQYDLHTLPGGSVDAGEDFHTAVKREIWEETGCECEIIGELGTIYENRSEHDFTQKRYYYLARVIGEKGSLHLTDAELADNTTVVWLPLEKAIKIITEKEQDNYQRKFIQRRDIAALTEALTWRHLHDIPSYDTFAKIEPITKGWSGDKKYYVETTDGQRMLLRLADIKERDCKRAAYDMMELVYNIGVLTPKPIVFGLCDASRGCYSLSGWIDGKDVETALQNMSETEQYILGLKAGKTLRKIHTLPAPMDAESWGIRYRRKIKKRIEFYNSHLIKTDSGDILVNYLQNNQHLLDERPQTFIHSDYDLSNLMVTPDGQIEVIDFNYNNFSKDYGDPWWEFDAVHWGKEPPAHFYTGLIRGYFDGEPPRGFFEMLSYYHAYDALAALCDTSIGEQGKPEWRRHTENVLRWFDNMNNPVPTLFLKEFYVQEIDGMPYKLKEPYDFSFIHEYGKVFKIFDQQASGCICFGVSSGDHQYFIKYAGVKTINNYNLPVSDAIARLKAAVPKYRDLEHPLLIRLIEAKGIGGGYMLVFDWCDGESFSIEQPLSHERFSALPITQKIFVYEEILRFHERVAQCGYVAMDFNDYSTLYDFGTGEVKICDIDFYAKQSYINGMSRALGDPVVMSPEEFRIGGLIDEISNVYTMGATTFVLFSNNDRSPEAWPLDMDLYSVIKKAISDERDDRQQSIEQLINEWNTAKSLNHDMVVKNRDRQIGLEKLDE